MNTEAKEKVKKLIVDTMKKYKGARIDKVKAINYIDIDVAGETVAEDIIQKLDDEFKVEEKDRGTIKWEE